MTGVVVVTLVLHLHSQTMKASTFSLPLLADVRYSVAGLETRGQGECWRMISSPRFRGLVAATLSTSRR